MTPLTEHTQSLLARSEEAPSFSFSLSFAAPPICPFDTPQRPIVFALADLKWLHRRKRQAKPCSRSAAEDPLLFLSA